MAQQKSNDNTHQTTLAAQALTQPAEQIALADLSVSPLNPRKAINGDELTALQSSIQTIGLIQSLAGVRQADGTVAIVAGGRRLRALQAIAEAASTDPATVMVPVNVTDSPDIAQAWATTENIVRQPLTTAEEIRAFGTMAEAGHDSSDIANAFGCTLRHVKGRLKLAHLPSIILDDLATGEITLDTASAYAVTDDPAQAEALYDELRGAYWGNSPREVRARLMADTTNADNRIARFVGREAYEAAGGAVTEDLFGDDVYFADPDLLSKLALNTLILTQAEHKNAGWKWAEIFLDQPSYDTMSKMGRVYPQSIPLSEEQAERYDALAEIAEADKLTDAERDEWELLLEAEGAETFTPEQMAQSGVIVTISFHGELECRKGYVRDEDTHTAIEAGVLEASRHSTGHSPTKEAAGRYPKALTEDMNILRTCAAQTALLDKPELALDLLTFTLVHNAYSGANVMELRVTEPANVVPTDEGQIVSERLQPAEQEWLRKDSAPEAFAAFRAQPKKARNAALTEAVARMLTVPVDGQANPLAKMIADLTKPDVRKVWTPTASFLKRLKAADLDAIMLHIDGIAVGSTFAKMKKGQKVERLAAIFEAGPDTPKLSRDQQARADAWVPDEMEPEAQKAEDAEATQDDTTNIIAIAAE